MGGKKKSARVIEAFINMIDGNYSRAIEIYRGILERHPRNVISARNLSLLLVLDGRYEEALEIINSYLGFLRSEKIRDPTIYKDLMLLKILIYLRMNKDGELINLIKRYLGEEIYICPLDLEEALNFDISLKRVVSELDDEEWLKIQRWLNRTKKDDLIVPIPKFVKLQLIEKLWEFYFKNENQNFRGELLALISILITSLGRVKRGLELAERALSLNPNSPYINMLYGKIKYLLGDPSTAFYHFKLAYKMLEGSKDRYIPLLNMGIILAHVGLYSDALKYVNKAIKMNLSSKNAWYIRARILLESERWRDAEKAFRALVQIDQKNPKAWIGLGKAYLVLGQLTKAVEAFLTAKRLIEEDNEELDYLITLARKLH